MPLLFYVYLGFGVLFAFIAGFILACVALLALPSRAELLTLYAAVHRASHSDDPLSDQPCWCPPGTYRTSAFDHVQSCLATQSAMRRLASYLTRP